MTGETLAKRLQRVLLDPPGEPSGEHLIDERGASFLQTREVDRVGPLPAGRRPVSAGATRKGLEQVRLGL